MQESTDCSLTSGVSQRVRIGIVGGGPGGLFTAWHLRHKLGDLCDIVIFEADDRLGGKIITKEIPGVGIYEAGVAEIYDYSDLGLDPLRDLIVNELGIELNYIEGGPCFLDGKLIHSQNDLAHQYGPEVHRDVEKFRQDCAAQLVPQDYYICHPETDNAHPWATMSGLSLLQTVKNETARRYLRVMAHSDVAAAPYQTNGLTFLRNAVMDLDGYMQICSVAGGNEKIVEELTKNLDADIRLNATAQALTPLNAGDSYCLEVTTNGVAEKFIADFVVLATPLPALSLIHWRSETLQNSIDQHISFFDRPAHYLRVVLVFERPFWRDHVSTHWWMLDRFDGCCVYDESSRNDARGFGILSFLIAGNAALTLANLSDERVEQQCLAALPPLLSEGRRLLVEVRVHRWMAAVNAIPGGAAARHRIENHVPDPAHAPGIVIVGDYLFDSTLNGVMDSADTASDIILGKILERQKHALASSQKISRNAVRESVEHVIAAWPPETILEMINIVWHLPKKAKILHFGSGSGHLVKFLQNNGYNAIGIEFDPAAYDENEGIAEFNHLIDLSRFDFPNQSFDLILETGLYRIPEKAEKKLIEHLFRISKYGLFLGSPALDTPLDLLRQYALQSSSKPLKSRWDWSEILYSAGFRLALIQNPKLDLVWEQAVTIGAGAGHWCESIDGILYSFYQTNSSLTSPSSDANISVNHCKSMNKNA